MKFSELKREIASRQPKWERFETKYPEVAAFAKQWAELMEAQLLAGQHIANVASRTAEEAGSRSLTLEQVLLAVKYLSRLWYRGTVLRAWIRNSIK